MDELQKAIAEFAAKQGATQLPNAGDKKSYQDARRSSWMAQDERQRNERQKLNIKG